MNIGSDNALLPDGTKAISEPVLVNHIRSCSIRLGFFQIRQGAILQEIFEIFILDVFENY